MEEWRDVPGYEGKYQVSNYGRVKSLNYNNTGKERIMSGEKIRGYYSLNLSKNGKVKRFRLNRLVWEAFNGPIPEGMEVNHINEDKTDNRLENLNLMTPKENSSWGTRSKRVAITQKNRKDLSKRVLQFEISGKLLNEYPSAREAERQTGLRRSNICNCCRGVKHVKTVGGYIWRYA